jgi:hypothetical protein
MTATERPDGLSRVSSAILAESVPDWQALWEAFGIAQNASPELEANEVQMATVEALRELHQRGLIDVVWRKAEPPWDLVDLDADRLKDEEFIEALCDAAWRKPHEQNGLAIYLGASNAGESLYKSGCLRVE